MSGRRPQDAEPLRAYVGALSLAWRYELTTTAVRAFARAAGYDDLVYYDCDCARAAGYRDLPAPPGYVGTPVYLPGCSDEVFSEPSFGQAGVPHDFPHLLDLGTETEYERPLQAGDLLIGTTRIADVTPRWESRGGDGLVVIRDIALVDEATGTRVARQRRSTLYCETLP